MNLHDQIKIPCETCGVPTPMLGTKRCDACHEVETQLSAYLRAGGSAARAFVEAALKVCPACHHTHAGPGLAGICIGCACEVRAPSVSSPSVDEEYDFVMDDENPYCDLERQKWHGILLEWAERTTGARRQAIRDVAEVISIDSEEPWVGGA